MTVNVVGDDGTVIARVKYNAVLDRWNGHDHNSGTAGRHAGLTRLRDGRYVLIHGSDFEGDRNYGEIISAKGALDQILRSGNDELLDEPHFSDLKILEKELIQEIGD